MSNPDRYYLGSEKFTLDSDDEQEKLVQRLRQYLNLRNVSLLVGNGASMPLGAPYIGDARAIIPALKETPHALKDEAEQASALRLLDILVPAGSAKLGIEPLLGTVTHLLADLETLPKATKLVVNGQEIRTGPLQALERLLKKWIYLQCKAVGASATGDKLNDHRELIRRFLLRSSSLPRVKVFTTNYDFVLERALDDLGVFYFDGFIGNVRRSLRSESYNYDLYYPGDALEGKVSRVERVVQLYKMHGSLNWRRNADGYRLDVVMDHSIADDAEFGQVMIYPSPLKVTEMNGYPYSEMFRHFSSQLRQPQSVLFTLGYSFNDDHINRIIYQALSVPSFVLAVVLPTFPEPTAPATPGPEHEVWRLINRVASKRILVLTGGVWVDGQGFTQGAGTLQDYATKWMPDITEMAIEAKVKEEAEKAIGSSEPTEAGEEAASGTRS